MPSGIFNFGLRQKVIDMTFEGLIKKLEEVYVVDRVDREYIYGLIESHISPLGMLREREEMVREIGVYKERMKKRE